MTQKMTNPYANNDLVSLELAERLQLQQQLRAALKDLAAWDSLERGYDAFPNLRRALEKTDA